MTLQVRAGSPWWVSAAADALLFLHIAGGAVGLMSGAAALIARKGGRAHRIAGLVFLVSMTIMASIGAAVSPFLPIPQRANVMAGVLTLYLVVSAWLAVRQKNVVAGRLEIAGLVVALTTAVTGVVWAVQASYSPTGTLDGSPPQAFYVFTFIGTLATVGDLRLILKGRISGAPRLARHLWRMCVALFIAAASFFLGQQKLMPVWMRGSPLLFVPTFAPLLWMAFWLIRIRLTKLTASRKSGASDTIRMITFVFVMSSGQSDSNNHAAVPVNGMFQPFAEPRSGTMRFAFTLPTAGRRLPHGRPLDTRRMS